MQRQLGTISTLQRLMHKLNFIHMGTHVGVTHMFSFMPRE